MKTLTTDGPSIAQAEHPGNAFVTITVDGKPIEIHRGSQTVATIKEKAGVPVAYELEQIVDGKLTPLPDDGRVTLKGDEQFISHPKDAGAS